MYYPRLRRLREDNDLSQIEVADILGTTQQQYSRYEKGIRDIPVCHLMVLAKLYKTTIDYIVGLTDE